MRTHTAESIHAGHAGDLVTVCGWVDRTRDMGGVQFLDVRDHTGRIQV